MQTYGIAAQPSAGFTLLQTHLADPIEDRQTVDPAELPAKVLDILSDAVVATDGSARVLYMNGRAKALLGRPPLAIRGGLLCTGLSRDTQRLHALVSSCVWGRGGGHMKIGAHLYLTMTALERSSAGEENVAVILVRDLQAVRDPSLESIVAYFGLTPAEARLAREILKGDGLARCARRLGTQVTTVRSHLRRIFEKTDTKRQAHLVRLLLSCGSGITDRDQLGAAPSAGRLEPLRFDGRR